MDFVESFDDLLWGLDYSQQINWQGAEYRMH
jgi:hypothetical protein